MISRFEKMFFKTSSASVLTLILASRSLLFEIFALKRSFNIHHRLFVRSSIFVTYFRNNIRYRMLVIIIVAKYWLDRRTVLLGAKFICIVHWSIFWSRSVWTLRLGWFFIYTLKKGLMRLFRLYRKYGFYRTFESFWLSFITKLSKIYFGINHFWGKKAWVILWVFVNSPMPNRFAINSSARSKSRTKYIVRRWVFWIFFHNFVHNILKICAGHGKALRPFHVFWRRRKSKSLLLNESGYHCWIICCENDMWT